jgi:hypothetical protein
MRTSTSWMRRRRKRTRTGSRLLIAIALAILAVLPAAGANRREKPAQPAVAVIAGTVFRTPGFALAGAEVTVVPKEGTSGSVKLKKTQVVSSTRGEWAVRVPAVPMEYTVYVKCSGYESQQKTVAIEGEHRREVSFMLDALPAGSREVK